jgi:Flp pilus assembly pilin Flp
VTVFGRVVSDERVTSIKFAVIAVLFSVAVFFTFGSLGSTLLNTTFEP